MGILITLGLVPTEEVAFVWPTVAPILAKAVERDEGRRSLHDILRELVNGQQALWLVSHEGALLGAVVTGAVNYARSRRLRIEWLAGERLDEWVHLIAEIEKHAKEYGFPAVETGGRPEFARVLEKHGYEIVGIEMRKYV